MYSRLSGPLHINRQSAYLIGRDPTVTDILIEHPSCSKQHAVIQREHNFGFLPVELELDCFPGFLYTNTDRQVLVKDEFGVSKPAIKYVQWSLWPFRFLSRVHILNEPADPLSLTSNRPTIRTSMMRRYPHRGSTSYVRAMVGSLCSLVMDTLLIPPTVIKFGLSDREYVLLHDEAT